MPRAATHAARTAAASKERVRSDTAAHRTASRTRRAARSTRDRGRSGPTARGTGPRAAAAPARAPARRTRPGRGSSRSGGRPRGATVLRLPVRSANGLLDGLLRGRAWVACVGLLLAGIVFLNVSLLGLNSGIAVTSERAAELRRENAELRLEVAKLGSSERIQRVAEARGFVMPAPGEVTYLKVAPEGDGDRAASALDAVADDKDAPG